MDASIAAQEIMQMNRQLFRLICAMHYSRSSGIRMHEMRSEHSRHLPSFTQCSAEKVAQVIQ